MPVRIQRMFDCQSQLAAIKARIIELGQRLTERPGDEGLRQCYRCANREAMGLSCQLARMAAEV